jgi:hypothetical protein
VSLHQAVSACPDDEVTLRIISEYMPVTLSCQEPEWFVIQMPFVDKEGAKRYEESTTKEEDF